MKPPAVVDADRAAAGQGVIASEVSVTLPPVTVAPLVVVIDTLPVPKLRPAMPPPQPTPSLPDTFAAGRDGDRAVVRVASIAVRHPQ